MTKFPNKIRNYFVGCHKVSDNCWKYINSIMDFGLHVVGPTYLACVIAGREFKVRLLRELHPRDEYLGNKFSGKIYKFLYKIEKLFREKL